MSLHHWVSVLIIIVEMSMVAILGITAIFGKKHFSIIYVTYDLISKQIFWLKIHTNIYMDDIFSVWYLLLSTKFISLPKEIKNLSKLETLDLEENQFKNISNFICKHSGKNLSQIFIEQKYHKKIRKCLQKGLADQQRVCSWI